MDDRNEILTAMFPPYSSIRGATSWTAQNGYQFLGSDAVFYTGNIDLSGYAMEDMTFATFDTMYQDPGIYSNTNATGEAAGNATKIEIIEMITDVPFDSDQLLQLIADMGTTVPGMLSTKQDFVQIIYGRYSLYVQNTTLGLPGYMQLISDGGFGSKEPTAASKLYCYKVIKTTSIAAYEPGETLIIPACRIGLSGRVFSEAELPYIMRLKRSYELQQLLN